MFFKNATIEIAVRFFWLGLVFGLIFVVFNLIIIISKRNLYISNIVGFCFWLAFGLSFSWTSISLYNYSFCWFGLLGMFLGFYLVKKTQQIFFTNFILLIYNSVTKRKLPKERLNGKV